MKGITKSGLIISMCGVLILLGSSVWRFLYGFWQLGIFEVCLGMIGLGGVFMGYYGGRRGAVRYLWLGFFYGVWFTGFYVFGYILMVGLVVFFIGSVVSYFGWYKEQYLRHYVTPKRERREVRTYASPLRHFQSTFREWRRAQPYICKNCGGYAFAKGNLCENCGVEHTLRVTTKQDYEQRNS